MVKAHMLPAMHIGIVQLTKKRGLILPLTGGHLKRSREQMKAAHRHLLELIQAEARETGSLTGRYQFSDRVMQAMAEVPREAFVPADYQYAAYSNGPLRIGYGQTISQPYIVALMTELLDLQPDSCVLEIGTGSGYQAAILSRLARQVYTIERIPQLADSARERFRKLGYNNIETRCCNGYAGWQEKAPFDAIIVTAAASHIPQQLVEQLKPGAPMVIPVGLPEMQQDLLLINREADGGYHSQSILAVAFVPLIGDQETNEHDAQNG